MSVSLQSDTSVTHVLGLAYCEPDPLLVEHVPHSRFDGLVARRSGAYCVSGSTGGQIYGIVGYLGRQNSFAGIVAINVEQLATADPRLVLERSDERRVGLGCVGTCIASVLPF